VAISDGAAVDRGSRWSARLDLLARTGTLTVAQAVKSLRVSEATVRRVLFAGICGVPFLPLPYAGKVADLAWAASFPLVTGVSRDCIGQLLATRDEVWDTRQQKGQEVGARLGRLSVQAHRPLESVLACLAQPSTRVQQSA
jgi:hypothetical protein